MNYLIIGGGIAGTTTAGELRKLDPSSSITIISNEKYPLYSRVVLPHYITGKIPRERVFLKTEQWYVDQNIILEFDEIVSLDIEKKTAQGKLSEYEFDKLLIAGGGIVNKTEFPGSENILHLQTVDDADKIKNLIESHAKDPIKPVAGIIGGGFIAMEFVEFFGNENFDSNVFLRGNKYFSNSFDDECSMVLENHLAKWQVHTHKHVEVKSYIDGVVELSDGQSLKLDFLVAGIGIRSSFDWAKDAGIEVNSGIVCNKFLETNIKDIYTAGDCAEFFDTISGQHVRIGNWMNALMQARTLAGNMTGDKKPFELVSSYATKVLGLDVISIGLSDATTADEILEFPSKDGHMLIFGRNGVAVGATLVNQTKERARITKIIKERTQISEI